MTACPQPAPALIWSHKDPLLPLWLIHRHLSESACSLKSISWRETSNNFLAFFHLGLFHSIPPAHYFLWSQKMSHNLEVKILGSKRMVFSIQHGVCVVSPWNWGSITQGFFWGIPNVQESQWDGMNRELEEGCLILPPKPHTPWPWPEVSLVTVNKTHLLLLPLLPCPLSSCCMLHVQISATESRGD